MLLKMIKATQKEPQTKVNSITLNSGNKNQISNFLTNYIYGYHDFLSGSHFYINKNFNLIKIFLIN